MITKNGKVLGGFRPGSGRKPAAVAKKAVIAYLRPELNSRLQKAAKGEGKSVSLLIAEAIETYLDGIE